LARSKRKAVRMSEFSRNNAHPERRRNEVTTCRGLITPGRITFLMRGVGDTIAKNIATKKLVQHFIDCKKKELAKCEQCTGKKCGACDVAVELARIDNCLEVTQAAAKYYAKESA